jgi:lipopolysaccharide transport system ATP-binding protein
VDGLGKQYLLGLRREPYATLRESLSGWANRLWTRRRRTPQEWMWALRDVNFEIASGELVGVIGNNGAGKSTLLKILSRITDPTCGYAEIRGRVGALLEVGTGFHLELTGRENIYLSGAILGMSKREIDRNFDEIVAFSEVERFIDTAVKHYSSGMYLRLAFAVAAQLEPEILLMDEVLAVGDSNFQKKCLGKMGAVARGGRTVLFVSHNLGAVRDLCTRAIWLHDGRVRADGDVEDVLRLYMDEVADTGFSCVNPEYEFCIESVRLRDDLGRPIRRVCPGESLSVEIAFDARKPLVRPYVVLLVESMQGKCFTANMMLDGREPELLCGRQSLMCTFRSVPLLPQRYTVKLGIRSADGRDHIVRLQDVASFDVEGRLEEFGMDGNFKGLAARSTPVVIPYAWTYPDGTVSRVELARTAHPPGTVRALR